jgi:DNA processing protein
VSATASTAVRTARAYLMAVAEPPAPALVALIDKVGPVQAAELVTTATATDPVSAEIAQWRGRVPTGAELLAQGEALGGRLIVPEDQEWPAVLGCFADAPDLTAPVGLWVRGLGRLDQLTTWGVVVCGTRVCSGYGEHLGASFACDLAEAGITVIASGGFGVGGAAVRGALAAQHGRALVVQPSGLGAPHPSAHARYLDSVAARGLVLTEYPPQARSTRRRLLAHTRLAAALASGGVLVIEAGAESTALDTAAAAAALGRPVMAVPGLVTSPLHAGSHRLIRDRVAVLVTSSGEVLTAAGLETRQ